MMILALIGLTLVILAVLCELFYHCIFMRNPGRTTPKGHDIVAPADGKIIEVIPYGAPQVRLLKGHHRFLGLIETITRDIAPSGHIISIFMSPLDVHYNRAPMTGNVVSVTHHKGKFVSASSVNAGLINEKSEIIIENKGLKVKMIQVAGFLARRVITDVRPDEAVTKGQIVGMIKLGSQVTLVLPPEVEPTIKKGDRVVAGETILAKINN